MKIKLPNGLNYGFDANGNKVCTGSKMGRQDTMPPEGFTHPKLRLERLKFTDGCYDNGGAYWGSPENLYCAWDNDGTRIFRRANSRAEAKKAVKEIIPCAHFYR
jgi:hypothetical protein